MSGVKSVGALVAKNFSAKFHVQPRYFNFILAGEKTVEGRIAREKYLSLKPGDAIQFLTENSYTDQERVEAQPSYKTLDARVVSLKRFSSFFQKLNQNQQDRHDRNQILMLPSDSPISFALAINRIRLYVS
jgi:ASC-1-like (ASCH) protein